MNKPVNQNKNSFFLILIFFLSFFRSSSQNIVENGSFEDINKVISFPRVRTMIQRAYPWLGESVDLFCPKQLAQPIWLPIPSQKAQDGNLFIGIVLSSPGQYESVTGSFKEVLKEGFRYKLSFYYKEISKNCPDEFNIDIKFFDTNLDTVRSFGHNTFISDSLKSYSLSFNLLKNRRHWQLFETEFKAIGYEKYFSVYKPFENKTPYNIYCYMDNFQLIRLDAIDETNEVKDKIVNNSILRIAEKIILTGELNFEKDKSELTISASDTLNKLAGALLKKDYTITINGYTDNSGSQKHNTDLSLQRGMAVRDFFIQKRMRSDKIIVNGFGEENPIDSNKTKEGKKKNRRVEIIIETATTPTLPEE